MDENQTLELYKVEQQRYHNSLGYLHGHLKYYYTIIAAVFVGTYWVWKEFRFDSSGNIALLSGGVLLMLFAKIGLVLVQSGYRHWLESITSLAKYEEKLDLHKARSSSELWPKEPFVFPRYQKEFADFCSASHFVEDRMKRGSMKWMRLGFYLIVAFGVVSSLLVSWGLIRCFLI